MIETPALRQDMAMTTASREATESREARKQLVLARYDQLPLRFEANQGQTDGQVKFLSRGRGYTLFLTPNEAVLALHSHPRSEEKRPQERKTARNEQATTTVFRIKVMGANPAPEILGLAELPGKSNYFIGKDPQKWQTNVASYARVKYHDVYPGVDLVYYGHQGQLENDFVVAPGASPAAIKLDFQAGAESESIPRVILCCTTS